MEFVVLLPPSQRKAEGGDGKPIKAHEITVELLKDINEADPQKIYTSRIEEAQVLNAKALSAPTMPAIQRYQGVVYSALDYDSLENTHWVDEHVRICSPVFGVIKATTNIPNYKFTMNKLRAYKRWKQENTRRLKDCFVVDLLASTQQKAVSYDNGVEIDFTRTKNGKVVKAGHAGKAIKGKFVRWMAKNTVTSEEDLYGFEEDGYSWNGEAFHKD